MNQVGTSLCKCATYSRVFLWFVSIATDPPFTPLPASDSRGVGPASLQESSRTTPPRSTTGTSRASSRRRSRPTAAREEPDKRESQQQHDQEVAPQLISRAPCTSEQLPGNQQQQGGQEQIGPRRRKEQPRQEPKHATPGNGRRRPDGEALNTSSLECSHGGRLLPCAPSPSIRSVCPSPPGIFSPSQPQQQQQIALGQHSSNEEDEQGEEEYEESGAAGGMLVSKETVDSVEVDGEHDDSTREGRYLDSRRVATTAISAGDRRGRRRRELGSPDSCLRPPDGGRGHIAAAFCTVAQQIAPERTAAGLNKGDHGDEALAGCGGDGGGDKGGDGDSGGQANVATEAVAVAHSAKRNALPRAGGDAAASVASRRVASSPGDAVDGSTRSKNDEIATRADDDEVTGAAGVGGATLGEGGAPSAGVENVDDNGVRCKIAGTSSSIWADLDGFASSDGSNSDDERGHSGKLACSPTRVGSGVPFGQKQRRQQEQLGAESMESGGGCGDVDGADSLLSDVSCRSLSSSPHNDNPNDGDREVTRSSGTHHRAAAVAVAGAAGDVLVVKSPGRGAGRGPVPAAVSGGFSLLRGGMSSLGDDDLLDAALDDDSD